jgi:hypothetical protein
MKEVFTNHRKRNSFIFPILIFLFSMGISRWLGYEMYTIPWKNWQLLDRELLLSKPLESLFYLHSQPPLLNIFLALTLWISKWLPLSPEAIAHGFFISFGLGSVILFFGLIGKLTGNLAYAIIATILLVANPSTWYFQRQFYYPFLLFVFFIVLIHSLETYFRNTEEEAVPGLPIFLLMVFLITSVRSLYHPFWAVGLVSLVFLFHLWISEKRIRTLRASKKILYTAAILAVFIVPLKNKLVFDQFTTSSWTGFNLIRGTKQPRETLREFKERGVVPPPIEKALHDFETTYNLEEPNVLSQINKSTGGTNMNHYLLLEVNPVLTRRAVQYRLNNPLHWLKQTIYHYLTWSAPPFLNTYTYQLRGPSTPSYLGAASIYETIFYLDARPSLEKLMVRKVNWPSLLLLREEVAYPIFGIFYFPVLMVLSLITILRKFKQGDKKTTALMVVMIYNIIWALLVPILTDGFESNRMRYAVFPLLITLSMMVISHFSELLHLRQGQEKQLLHSKS